MSIVASEMTPADIAAVTNNGSNNGFGFNGDGAWWLLILFLFAFNGNWGNGFGGGSNDVQRGFDQSSVMNGINGLTSAVSTGFANAEISRCNAQTNLLQTLNTMTLTQQANCFDTRSAIESGVRDIITSQSANTQAILDKLCQQEIDALKTQNANLQTQINMANLAASQTAQTARILADNAAQTAALEQYLNPSPIPAYVVQNPNCCTNFGGCGCSGV